MSDLNPNIKRPQEDPVARSIAKPDAFAKPGTLSKPVRIRLLSNDKSVKIRRKRKNHDRRDVAFY